MVHLSACATFSAIVNRARRCIVAGLVSAILFGSISMDTSVPALAANDSFLSIHVLDTTTNTEITNGQTIPGGHSFMVSVTSAGVDCTGQFAVTALGAPGAPPSCLVQVVPFQIGPSDDTNVESGTPLGPTYANNWKISTTANGNEAGKFGSAFFEFYVSGWTAVPSPKPNLTITAMDLTTGQPIAQGSTISSGDEFNIIVTTTNSGVNVAGQWVVSASGASGSSSLSTVPWIIGPPDSSGTVTSAPISTDAGNFDYKISASGNDTGPGQTCSADFEFFTAVAPAPQLSPAGGTVQYGQQVTIKDSLTDATIYYTEDGSKPTTASSVYAGPITLTHSRIIRATALAPGYALSPVTSTTFTVIARQSTITNISTSANPSNFGSLVTFTAIVSPAPLDGESITFVIDNNVAIPETISGGVATLATPSLRVGDRRITASYPGDSTYLPSSSGVLPQIVQVEANVNQSNPNLIWTAGGILPATSVPYTEPITLSQDFQQAWIGFVVVKDGTNVSAPSEQSAASILGSLNVIPPGGLNLGPAEVLGTFNGAGSALEFDFSPTIGYAPLCTLLSQIIETEYPDGSADATAIAGAAQSLSTQTNLAHAAQDIVSGKTNQAIADLTALLSNQSELEAIANTYNEFNISMDESQIQDAIGDLVDDRIGPDTIGLAELLTDLGIYDAKALLNTAPSGRHCIYCTFTVPNVPVISP